MPRPADPGSPSPDVGGPRGSAEGQEGDGRLARSRTGRRFPPWLRIVAYWVFLPPLVQVVWAAVYLLFFYQFYPLGEGQDYGVIIAMLAASVAVPLVCTWVTLRGERRRKAGSEGE